MLDSSDRGKPHNGDRGENPTLTQRMELHHARSVSFEGKKVTCIAGSGTVSVGVIEYNPVQRESLVVDFSTGTGPTFMDVVKMFDSHPSSIVEFLSEEEQLLFSKVKSKRRCRYARRSAWPTRVSRTTPMMLVSTSQAHGAPECRAGRSRTSAQSVSTASATCSPRRVPTSRCASNVRSA